MEEILLGRYKHFKGKDYEVLLLAKNSETLEDVVVYRALYGDHSVWTRPASMWNDMVERNGKTFRRFTYVPPEHYLFVIREYLERNNCSFDDTILKSVEERKAGKTWSLPEHIKALVYALLTNQTKWSRIVPHLKDIDRLFCEYDPDALKALSSERLTQGLFALKCGNISTAKQMKALTRNIAVFERIEKEYGSVDSFVTSGSAADVVGMLSSTDSEYKLSMVGEALAWEYIRNAGVDGIKPDTHVRRFLGKQRMGESVDEEATVDEALEQAKRLSEETGLTQSTIDALIWHFCAEGYGEVCSATPHCERCPIRNSCSYERA